MDAIPESATTEQKLVRYNQQLCSWRALCQQLHDWLDERFAENTHTFRQTMSLALSTTPLSVELRSVVLSYLECPLHVLLAPLIGHCLHGSVLLRYIATDEFRRHRRAARQAGLAWSDYDALRMRRRQQLTDLWRSERAFLAQGADRSLLQYQRDVAPSLDPRARE